MASNTVAYTEGGCDSAIYHTVKVSDACNMYRNIENPYSNVSTWVDGFLANKTTGYASVDKNKYGDSTSNYTNVGFSLPASNWINGFGYSEVVPYGFVPNSATSTEAYVKDKIFTNTSSGVRSLCVGGHYRFNSDCGLFYFGADAGPSYTYANLGSRLIYLS